MGPIRSCADIRTMTADSVRPIILDDFIEALRAVRMKHLKINKSMLLTCSICFQVRSSVATKDLRFYKEWNEEFGSFAFESHESS